MTFLPSRICRLGVSAQRHWRQFATLNNSSREDTGQNLTEKIVQRYVVDLPPGKIVRSGDYVSIKPEHCMSHDNSWPVAMKFMGIGAKKILDNRQVVMTLDHDVQNKSEKNLEKYANIERFAKEQGVDFYPAGRGIGHQILVEEGYAFPYTMTVASDSHSNMYGGVGCLGTPMVRTDAAAIWATGRTWWQIPPVAKVEFQGSLRPGVTGKDVIITLCGMFNRDEVLNHAIEFTGLESIRSLGVDERLAIANMTTEWGALSGLFPVDDVLLSWYRKRAQFFGPGHPRISNARLDDIAAYPIQPSPNATYAKHLTLNLSSLSPSISGPNSVKLSTPASVLSEKNIAIQKAYLVSCTNSRLSDLTAAADMVRGKKIADGVEFYVAAASSEVQKQAEESGAWGTLVDAGARTLPAGCGPCIGLGTGLLKDGEVGISATNRNFKGRMGSPNAQAYLASPAVVAASAVAGKIVSPFEIEEQQPERSIEVPKSKPAAAASSSTVEILEGFPETIEGEIIFVDADNLNTDGIYPGKYTYQDNVPREKMREVCMENYDPKFGSIAKDGDILLGGYNFGSGSSREQAATAILARNIPMVVAGSFGDIFKRNSINNALLCVEVPALLEKLRALYKNQEPALTRRTGWKVKWDVRNSRVQITEDNGETWEVKVGELGGAVQELFVKGGLEGWVKSRL